MSIPGVSWGRFPFLRVLSLKFSIKFRGQSSNLHSVQCLQLVYGDLNVSMESMHTINLKMAFHLFVIWARLTETIDGLYYSMCWLTSVICENTNMICTCKLCFLKQFLTICKHFTLHLDFYISRVTYNNWF